MKHVKLSTKIAAGFFALIAIMVALGVMAIWVMGSVKSESIKLSDEYVPEVAVANEVERNSLMTMYNMRGYTMSYDPAYLEKGRSFLAKVDEHLKKAEELSNRAVHLAALKGQVGVAKSEVKKYTELLDKTVANVDELAKVRVKLNESAGRFAKYTVDFAEGQKAAFYKELQEKAAPDMIKERFFKVELINSIIEMGSNIRLQVWKGQALNDDKILAEALKTFEPMEKARASLRGVTRHEEDLKRLDEIKASAEEYRGAITEYEATTTRQAEVNKERAAAADRVLEAAQTTSSKGIEHTAEIATSAASSLASSLWILVVGLLIASAIGIVLAFGITLSISRPLKKAIDSMKQSTSEIDAASNELASASQQLSSGASEQASSIEETSASLEEMGGMVQNNVTNAQKAKDLAAQVKSISEQGNTSMEKLQTSMKEILESNQQIEQLVKVIGEIGEKTKVMDEIVFQTKLLSFNASVEAERAGEHGRGFAVVAQEVGNLAQMSGKSAQEIAQIVTSSIRQAEAITTENKKKVETGNSYVLETGKYLKEIMSSAGTVTDGAQQVVAASQEQAAGIKQINLAMSNLDKATQQNSAMAEETASTSEELNAQTANLNLLVSQLVQLVDGGDAGHSTHENVPTASSIHHRPLKAVSSIRKKEGSPAPKPMTKGLGLVKKAVGSDVNHDGVGSGDDWDKI